MRIAIMDLEDARWSAGGTFSEVVVRSLRLAGEGRVEVLVFNSIRASRWDGIATVVRVPESFPHENLLREKLRLSSVFERYCEKNAISALVLAPYVWPGPTTCKRIVWIPDFQHLHLPQYFSEHDVEGRSRWIATMAKRAEGVMLSSEAVRSDFLGCYPRYAGKAAVLRFPSLLAFSQRQSDSGHSRIKYNIPDKFLFVANQFWAHKNHKAVIEAISILRKQRILVPVVFTGLPSDFRDPSNATTSGVLQSIAEKGLAGQVIPLGLVARHDMLDLLRCASVVVQPSRFEGWSTVIQDARALGRPLICSDIPVHREQVPDALGFFDCDDPESLAALIGNLWPDLAPGPDGAREVMALDEHRVFAKDYAAQLLEFCS